MNLNSLMKSKKIKGLGSFDNKPPAKPIKK
jgi:hypothetical protein